MVAIGVATVWLVRGLIAITHNQIPVCRDEAHHEASMGSASKPGLGYPWGLPAGHLRPSSGAPGSTRAEGAMQTGGAAGEMVSAIGTDDLDLGRGNILAYPEFSP